MYCQKCGAELPEGAAFCGECGFRQVTSGYSQEHSRERREFEEGSENGTRKRSLHDVFEEEQFDDDSQADSYQEYARKKIKLSIIALVVALLATFFFGFSHSDIFNPLRNLDVPYALGFICTVTAYVLGGGIKHALRIVGVVLSVIYSLPAPFLGLLILQFILLAFCAIMSIFIILFFPAIFVLINHISLRINLRRAKEYLY